MRRTAADRVLVSSEHGISKGFVGLRPRRPWNPSYYLPNRLALCNTILEKCDFKYITGVHDIYARDIIYDAYNEHTYLL